MARLRFNNQGGTTTDNPLTAGATTFNSAALASLPVVTGPDYAIVIFEPNTANEEIVQVSAHTAAATSATIVRAQESTTAISHASGSVWIHGPTVVDFVGDTISGVADGYLSSNVDLLNAIQTISAAKTFSGGLTVSAGVLTANSFTSVNANAKPAGNGAQGYPIDWGHNDSAGYLMHLITGPNMTGGAVVGIGVGDNNQTNPGLIGLLVNNKQNQTGVLVTNAVTTTANAVGFSGTQNSTAGILMSLQQTITGAGLALQLINNAVPSAGQLLASFVGVGLGGGPFGNNIGAMRADTGTLDWYRDIRADGARLIAMQSDFSSSLVDQVHVRSNGMYIYRFAGAGVYYPWQLSTSVDHLLLQSGAPAALGAEAMTKTFLDMQVVSGNPGIGMLGASPANNTVTIGGNGLTVSAGITLNGNINAQGNAGAFNLFGPSSGLLFRDSTNNFTNFGLTDAGLATFRNNLTVTGSIIAGSGGFGQIGLGYDDGTYLFLKTLDSNRSIKIQANGTGTISLLNATTITTGGLTVSAGNFGLGLTNPTYGVHQLGGGQRLQALATPTLPTVTPTGVTGSTTYNYYIVAKDRNGYTTLVSPVGSTATGNATLTAGNYNALSWTAVTGAVTYDVLVSNTATSVALGLTTTTYNDIGGSTSAYTTPTRNTTADVTIDGALTVSAGGASIDSTISQTISAVTKWQFSVDGTFGANGWRLRDAVAAIDRIGIANSNGHIYMQPTSGNVGIGITSAGTPGTLLDVNGAVTVRSGGVAVTAGGVTISAGGINVTGTVTLPNQSLLYTNLDAVMQARVTQVDPGNSLMNSTFEQSSGPTNMFWSTGGSIIVSSANAHSGNNYLSLSSGGGVTVTCSQVDESNSSYINFEVTGGSVLYFGGWGYRESGDTNAGIYVQAFDKDKSAIAAAVSTSFFTSASWVQQTATYTVPAAAKYVRFFVRNSGGVSASVSRFDDLFLTTQITGSNIKAGPHFTSVVVDSGGLTVTAGTTTIGADLRRSRGTTSVAGAGTVTPVATTQEILEITYSGSFTLAAPTGLAAGQYLTFKFIHDATANAYVITWNAIYKRAGGAFANTNTANAADQITFYCDGTNWNEIGRALALA